MDNISWHIEPTSKCTLECPLCDRTWFYNKFGRRELHEINVDQLVNFLGNDANLTFCGNNGDPIYHSKFIELCSKLKSNNCKIAITTNGSYRTIDWWKKLAQVLNKTDKITFSIDGLEDTNHLYRINSDWKMIMDAIDILIHFSTVSLTWKFIVFKHNQHQINEAKQLSKKLGFEKFRLEYSDRWWDKSLMPDKKYIDNNYEHQQRVVNKTDNQGKMKPKCLKNGKPANALYIDSEGNFYPCCWTGLYTFRYKTMFSPKNSKYNIKNITIKNILEDIKVKNFFETTKNYESAHDCCKIYCGVSND